MQRKRFSYLDYVMILYLCSGDLSTMAIPYRPAVYYCPELKGPSLSARDPGTWEDRLLHIEGPMHILWRNLLCRMVRPGNGS